MVYPELLEEVVDWGMEVDDTGWGENIWDASTWRIEITNKEELVKAYLDDLQFPDSQAQVIDFVETYYRGVFERAEEEEGAELNFVNNEIVTLLVNEFIFGVMDDETFTALQELKLLEVTCSWFYNRKTDALTYTVFDTLFSNMYDEVLSEVMKGAKFEFLKKLASFSVGVKCSTFLDCVAIWMKKLGAKDDNCLQLMSSIIHDYCSLVPSSVTAMKQLVHVSPLFTFEVISVLPTLYNFASLDEEGAICDDGEEADQPTKLPSDGLIAVIATWVVTSPNILDLPFPRSYLKFPSIIDENQTIEKDDYDTAGLVLGLLKIVFLTGLLKPHPDKRERKGQNEGEKKNDQRLLARSEALYQILLGILKFLVNQNKAQNKIVASDDEDLEPGEVLDEEEVRPLIAEEQFLRLLRSVYESYEARKDEKDDQFGKDCANKLAHVIQVGKASHTIGCTYEKAKGILKRFPKTRLLSLVVSKLSG